jgi:hypothetical protein
MYAFLWPGRNRDGGEVEVHASDRFGGLLYFLSPSVSSDEAAGGESMVRSMTVRFNPAMAAATDVSEFDAIESERDDAESTVNGELAVADESAVDGQSGDESELGEDDESMVGESEPGDRTELGDGVELMLPSTICALATAWPKAV